MKMDKKREYKRSKKGEGEAEEEKWKKWSKGKVEINGRIKLNNKSRKEKEWRNGGRKEGRNLIESSVAL